MEYTRTEREAIASVLYNLAHVDFREHESENEVYNDCLLLMENAFLECWHSHKTSPAFSKADDVICPKLYFPTEMYSFNAAT